MGEVVQITDYMPRLPEGTMFELDPEPTSEVQADGSFEQTAAVQSDSPAGTSPDDPVDLARIRRARRPEVMMPPVRTETPSRQRKCRYTAAGMIQLAKDNRTCLPTEPAGELHLVTE